MEERLQFVRAALSDRFTMSELCARYGGSRQIGYKWLARYEAEGRAELFPVPWTQGYAARVTSDAYSKLIGLT